jgi:hypothetical protein
MIMGVRTLKIAICRECGQEKKIAGRGLCHGCYMPRWESGTLDEFPILPREPKPIPIEKACAICKVVKPLDDFAKNNRRADGRGSYCKPCAREKYHRPAAERNRSVERPALVTDEHGTVVWSEAEGTQKCRKCGEVRPLSQFYWEADKGRHRYRCKDCHLGQSRQRWQRTGGRNQRLANLKSKFGLTEDQYAELLAAQGGRCKICGRTPKELGRRYLAVDHCHTNGHVRGLLCSACNCGIGMFGDDIARLQSAIEYLMSDEMRE